MSGHTTALRGRNGVLFAKPEGESTHFERNWASIRKTCWRQFRPSMESRSSMKTITDSGDLVLRRRCSVVLV